MDLCLVPYGCVATGPKSGFIEVVKNARTIADVSGVTDDKKLLEWITSHQLKYTPLHSVQHHSMHDLLST